MDSMIILDRLEEEYLIRVSESSIDVRKMRQFFLWTQGQVQGLLPHHVLVCMQFGDNDEIVTIECVDRLARDGAFVALLCHPEDGVAVRLAKLLRAGPALPCVLQAHPRDSAHPLSQIHREILAHGLHNAIAHGTERVRGGATFFVLFGMPQAPGPRQLFFFELLLPYLHLAFQRVLAAGEAPVAHHEAMKALTARELEILTWVMLGKSNYEIGAILQLSTLTVKNHLQKIYRKLNVHTRVQAVSRCWDLQSVHQGRKAASAAPRKPAKGA